LGARLSAQDEGELSIFNPNLLPGYLCLHYKSSKYDSTKSEVKVKKKGEFQ
jgi:hypothetical protein